MQSFFQHRRFRKAVEAQYERNQEKTLNSRGTSHGDALSSTQPGTTTSDIYDLEKGDPESENGREAGRRTSARPESEESPRSDGGIGRDNEMHEMQLVPTQKSLGTKLGTTMTGIDVRDRTTREGKSGGRVFVVGYEGDDDPLNPHNWSFVTRMGAT